ncbi:MAG: hypothetical protein HFH72_08265 [Lachnospiraceae bacterium]|nr:hypothetical protein [Lachnospiraceae bacterium]
MDLTYKGYLYLLFFLKKNGYIPCGYGSWKEYESLSASGMMYTALIGKM